MEILHRTHNLKIAPRKLRLVADKMRHQDADKALASLPLYLQKAAGMIQKSLKAAVMAAKDQNLEPATLVIQRIWCDEGMKLKRMVMKSHGQSTRIMKHHSHLSIVLKGEPQSGRTRAKAATPEIEPVAKGN